MLNKRLRHSPMFEIWKTLLELFQSKLLCSKMVKIMFEFPTFGMNLEKWYYGKGKCVK